MKNGNEKKEINEKDLQTIVGGNVPGHRKGYDFGCRHRNKVRTGEDRERPNWIFFTQHQYRYYCPDCGKKIWVDEERD